MGETFSDILHKQKQRSRKEGSAQKEEGAQAAKERVLPRKGSIVLELSPAHPTPAEARGCARAVPRL